MCSRYRSKRGRSRSRRRRRRRRRRRNGGEEGEEKEQISVQRKEGRGQIIGGRSTIGGLLSCIPPLLNCEGEDKANSHTLHQLLYFSNVAFDYSLSTVSDSPGAIHMLTLVCFRVFLLI